MYNLQEWYKLILCEFVVRNLPCRIFRRSHFLLLTPSSILPSLTRWSNDDGVIPGVPDTWGAQLSRPITRDSNTHHLCHLIGSHYTSFSCDPVPAYV